MAPWKMKLELGEEAGMSQKAGEEVGMSERPGEEAGMSQMPDGHRPLAPAGPSPLSMYFTVIFPVCS